MFEQRIGLKNIDRLAITNKLISLYFLVNIGTHSAATLNLIANQNFAIRSILYRFKLRKT